MSAPLPICFNFLVIKRDSLKGWLVDFLSINKPLYNQDIAVLSYMGDEIMVIYNEILDSNLKEGIDFYIDNELSFLGLEGITRPVGWLEIFIEDRLQCRFVDK